ncbi:MAG: SGNH/GDSL hydrolase family protein, partial [Candidatus Dormibacteria bacterium]
DAWPAAFYTQSLPRATVFYNLGIGGETTAAALSDELPRALQLRPTLATVWLNVDDLGAGVTVADYESQLTTLVRSLRQGGRTRVFVANTPVLDSLPLVRFCLGEGPPPSNSDGGCPISLPGGVQLTRALLDTSVAAYNQAIGRVVTAEGAVLVDLHAQGDVAGAHPDYVDREDGFHPSDRGHAAIAAAFASALRGAGGI